MGIFMVFFLSAHFEYTHNANDPDYIEKNKAEGTIMILLFIEHILAYIAEIYRRNEIRIYGKPDINGIYRAPKETFLRNI